MGAPEKKKWRVVFDVPKDGDSPFRAPHITMITLDDASGAAPESFTGILQETPGTIVYIAKATSIENAIQDACEDGRVERDHRDVEIVREALTLAQPAVRAAFERIYCRLP